MERRNILIVGGSAEERDLCSRYLEFVGGRVAEAADTEEAVPLAQAELPDLILLHRSDRGRWREFMRRLRAESATADIPVLALTTEPLSEERLEEEGFCGAVERPVALARLLGEVERCIGRLDVSDLDLLAHADSQPSHATTVFKATSPTTRLRHKRPNRAARLAAL